MQIEVVAANDTSDLRKRDADIAIRHFRPEDPELLTTLLPKSSPAWMYASPTYLERIGNPASFSAFAKVATVFGFDERPRMRMMLNGQGHELAPDNFAIRTEDHLVQWEMAKQGLGVCIMMQSVGEAEPRLKRLFSEHPPPATFPTWLTTHKEYSTNRRIRLVFDRLAETLPSKL